MCFSQKLSFASLCFGVAACLSLVYYGSEKYRNTNTALALFFLFVSLMQLVEFLLWSDMHCKTGWNQFGAVVGPLLNHLQPVVLLALAVTYLNPVNIIPLPVVYAVNAMYVFYVGSMYKTYIRDKSNLCVGLNQEDHLEWTWKKSFDYGWYFLVSLINMVNFYTNIHLVITVVISYSLLVLSYFGFHRNIGEFWCLMVTGVPFVNLFVQKMEKRIS